MGVTEFVVECYFSGLVGDLTRNRSISNVLEEKQIEMFK